MKFTLNWLKQHLDTDLRAEQIAENLNKLGMEVEELEDTAKAYDNVVIGKIITRVQHPNADTLGVCQVQVGENDIRQIVCGAPNARDGLTVAVALEGACLPGDFKITKSKLRGETSNGMICSVKELGLGTESDGIWEVETDLAIGTPIIALVDDVDAVFDIDITPNRGDVLSVYGVARDLAAAGFGTLKTLESKDYSNGESTSVKVNMNNDKCSFFSSFEIKGVNNVESPLFITEKLEKVGLRPINAIADITNYVMLELGQPIHAYDANKLTGDITVGVSKGGEVLNGLDGAKHTLKADAITINDDSGVIGLGGIVGGVETSVDENTTDVFLEAAHFNKVTITLTGQAQQINTDARYRFERRVDPAMTRIAIAKAAELIQQICGGQVSELTTFGTDEVKPRVIEFDTTRMLTFAGVDLDTAECIKTLEDLHFVCTKKSDTVYNVTVPSFITIADTDADLIEEILRLKSFDIIPVTLPAPSLRKVNDWDSITRLDRTSRRTLVSLGYLEAINYSFVSPRITEIFAEKIDALVLANPISEDLSNMRQSLVPGLVESLAKNVKRGQADVMFAEVGRVFAKDDERLQAAAVRMGSKEQKSWNTDGKVADVFDIKSDLIKFLETIGVDVDKLMFKDTGCAKYYHPGRSASVMYKGKQIAQFGEIHPFAAKKILVKSGVVMFEVDLQALVNDTTKKGEFKLSQFQAVKRDFAFVIDQQVKAFDVLQTVKSSCRPLAKDATIFDLYEGENLGEGKKSLAISVTLQSDDKTLKEDEINAVAEKTINAVCKRFKAEIR